MAEELTVKDRVRELTDRVQHLLKSESVRGELLSAIEKWRNDYAHRLMPFPINPRRNNYKNDLTEYRVAVAALHDALCTSVPPIGPEENDNWADDLENRRYHRLVGMVGTGVEKAQKTNDSTVINGLDKVVSFIAGSNAEVDEIGFIPTLTDLQIMEALCKSNTSMTQVDIEAKSGHSLKTLKRLLPVLENHSIVSRPNGPRKGYVLTPAGRALLTSK